MLLNSKLSLLLVSHVLLLLHAGNLVLELNFLQGRIHIVRILGHQIGIVSTCSKFSFSFLKTPSSWLVLVNFLHHFQELIILLLHFVKLDSFNL